MAFGQDGVFPLFLAPPRESLILDLLYLPFLESVDPAVDARNVLLDVLKASVDVPKALKNCR